MPESTVTNLGSPQYLRDNEYLNMPELPTYVAPEWDYNRIKGLTQKYAAGGLRALRQQVNRAMGMNYANPNLKRMTLREALAGYGQGLENVLGGAAKTAASEYSREYATKEKESEMNYQAQLKKMFTEYLSKYSDYIRATYGGGGSSSIGSTKGGGGFSGGVSGVSWVKGGETWGSPLTTGKDYGVSTDYYNSGSVGSFGGFSPSDFGFSPSDLEIDTEWYEE